MATDAKPYKYDIILSYAGEDRDFARALTNALRLHNVKVYDKDENPIPPGIDYRSYVRDLYLNLAKHCVIILSRYYMDRYETKQELDIARARASKDKDYIIYVLLDETLRSTLPPTAVYFSVTEKDLGKVADGIKKKVDQPSQSSAASPQKPILPIDSTTPGVTPISINIDTSDASQKTKDEWLKAGDEADDAGQYQDALDAYEKAIKCDDKDPRGYRGKSKALKRLGRACEAEDAEEEAE